MVAMASSDIQDLEEEKYKMASKRDYLKISIGQLRNLNRQAKVQHKQFLLGIPRDGDKCDPGVTS